MLYKIADLLVEIPDAGGMSSRCREYRYLDSGKPDIIIDSSRYRNHYQIENDDNLIAYMESARQFLTKLIHFNGIYLHASAVEFDGRAYLFSGPCGMGKSTHAKLWQQTFGSAAQVFNDDKPALRRIDGQWYAYGTPWCGKDGINQNKKVPLAGICFLQQADRNEIYRLESKEAVKYVFSQTANKFRKIESLDLMLKHVECLVGEIPIYLLENKPNVEAALLSHKTMCSEVKETEI